jgi:hypothetical protein
MTGRNQMKPTKHRVNQLLEEFERTQHFTTLVYSVVTLHEVQPYGGVV